VDWESNVNILYGNVLDRIEDTPELVRKLINPQTQSLLYSFDGSEARSPDTVEFPVRVDSFNVVTEFCFYKSNSLTMPSSGGRGSTR